MDFILRSQYFDTLEVFSFAMYTVGMGKPATELNERQWLFVDEYVKSSHATNNAVATRMPNRLGCNDGYALNRRSVIGATEKRNG